MVSTKNSEVIRHCPGLNLVPFPQLACKFSCIFGYHVLNSTCPDFPDFLSHILLG